MLKKNFRLPIGEFKKNKSKSVSDDYFSVKFSQNSLNFNRFGVIISAKTEPKSSRRNFIKRNILEFSKKIPNQKTDFLVTVLGSIKNLKKEDITQEISKTFSKIIP